MQPGLLAKVLWATSVVGLYVLVVEAMLWVKKLVFGVVDREDAILGKGRGRKVVSMIYMYPLGINYMEMGRVWESERGSERKRWGGGVMKGVGDRGEGKDLQVNGLTASDSGGGSCVVGD